MIAYKSPIRRIYIALIILISLALELTAAQMTNADVVKMSEAKLDEKIIVTAIENSEPKFDTSTEGLIELSKAKVPPAVISAMIKRSSAPASSATGDSGNQSTGKLSPSELQLLEGDVSKPMKYLTPQTRTAARGLGFGGFASYAVLRGSSANFRIKNRQPAFIVSVPEQAQVESYATIASFAVRPNNSREVMIGGGYMSYSTGIHPDRVIAINSEKLPDQAKAEKGFVLYRMTPKASLPVGEYAVILYTGEMKGFVGPWFAGGANSYFDFGVD